MRVFIVILAGLMLGSCTGSPLAKNAAAFGTVASTVTKQSAEAYNTVELAFQKATVAKLIRRYETDGFKRDNIRPFLDPQDLAVRLTLLRSVQKYADLLQDVAGTRPIDQIQTEAAGLGQQLKTLTSDKAFVALGAKVDAKQFQLLSTAIATVGELVINAKRHKALPSVLDKMQLLLQSTCDVLADDIGTAPGLDGKGGRGLRLELWNAYNTLIRAQEDYIEQNKATLSATAKAAEIEKLPELLEQQRLSDAALAATNTGLQDMPKAHRALLNQANQPLSLAGALATLKDDAERIAGFYSGLKFK